MIICSHVQFDNDKDHFVIICMFFFQDTPNSRGSPLLIFHPFTVKVIWYCRYVCTLNAAVILLLIFRLDPVSDHSVSTLSALWRGSVSLIRPCSNGFVTLWYDVIWHLYLRYSCLWAAWLQGLWDPREDGCRYCHHAAEHRRWGLCHPLLSAHTFMHTHLSWYYRVLWFDMCLHVHHYLLMWLYLPSAAMSSYLYIVKYEFPLVIQAFLMVDNPAEWVVCLGHETKVHKY